MSTPQNNAMNNHIGGITLPMPRPITPGNPGFQSRPIVPKTTLNNNEPGSLGTFFHNLLQRGRTNPGTDFAGQYHQPPHPSPNNPVVHQGSMVNQPPPPSYNPTPSYTPAPTQQPTQQTGQQPLLRPTTPQVGNQMQNAQNVLDASNLNNNAQYQALASQNSLLTQAQNNVASAGTSGSQNTINQQGTDMLGNKYSNLFRPQSTGNLQGEKGILNPYLVNAQAGNTAEAQRLLSGGQLATQGATSVLTAGQPQAYSPTNVPFNPLTGQYGNPASGAYGANGLAGVGGLLEQQNQGANTQNQILAYNQAKPLIETAKQQIRAAGFNASPIALANQLQQYVNKNVIPSGEYANIFNTLSEIATTISPVLGAQGAQTDLKTMIAQEFIPQLLQGKDLSSVFDNIEQNALAKINAGKQTATGQALNVPSGGSGGGGFAEEW